MTDKFLDRMKYRWRLADAQASGKPEDWAVVAAIEEAAMAERCLPEAEAAERLRGKPVCVACDALGMNVDATAVTKTHGALCHGCLFTLTATEMGWPIRGHYIDGSPRNPAHPWSREGKH